MEKAALIAALTSSAGPDGPRADLQDLGTTAQSICEATSELLQAELQNLLSGLPGNITSEHEGAVTEAINAYFDGLNTTLSQPYGTIHAASEKERAVCLRRVVGLLSTRN